MLKTTIVHLERAIRRNNIAIFGLRLNINKPVKRWFNKLNELLGTEISEKDINFVKLLKKTVTARLIIVKFS